MRLFVCSSRGSWLKSLRALLPGILFALGVVTLFVLFDASESYAEVAGSSTPAPALNSFTSSGARLAEYMRTHATTLASRPGTYFAKGVIIVEFSEEVGVRLDTQGALHTSSNTFDEVLRARGLLRAERLFPWGCGSRRGGECGFWRLTFPEQTDLDSLISEIKRVPGVTGIQPVGLHTVDHYPNDYYFPLQWGLNQKQDHDVNAPEAWDIEKGDSSIVVAIVDTGVDWSHPDLGGVTPYTGGNIWTNWAEFYGIPGVDDDNNGFVDDIRGWDFVTAVEAFPGEDGNTPDNDPSDFFGHGTHVSGIVAAITDNGIGVASLANKCKIMPVRAGWTAYGPGGAPAGVVRMDFCASAIFYAARNGARVINCSWANDSSGELNVAVDTAIARGAIVVVSAGNDASSFQDANYLSTRGDCFVVAATDSNDIREPHSNFGNWVSFSAPGAVIASTYYDGRVGFRTHTYAYSTGTSMAAPFVCALSALLLSRTPSLSRNEVFNIISSTCDPIDALNPGFAGLLGAGRINAYAALSMGSGNWVARADTVVRGSPLPMQSGLGRLIAVTGSDGCIRVLRPDGRVVSGWPKCGLGVPTSPAYGDIDGDGGKEVVVGSDQGKVYAWDVLGNSIAGWPGTLGNAVISGPMLCDLDRDGSDEIVCATADSSLHVLSARGTDEQGWPIKLPGYVTSDPCLAFMGIDSSAVAVVTTSDSWLRAFKSNGSEEEAWPVTASPAILRSPVAVDMDSDGRSEIVVGDSAGNVHAIDDTGASLAGWPQTASGSLSNSLGLGDVDGDRVLDVVGGTSNGWIYAWNLNGQLLSGWPVRTGGPVASSPSLVDLNSEGKLEVAIGSDDGDMHVFSSLGTPFPGWPLSTGGPVKSSPCIWDFDGDGLLELAVGSDDTKLHFWRLSGSVAVDSLLAWPMYRHDTERTANTGSQTSLPVFPVRPGLAVAAFPNPFRGSVTFGIAVTGGATGSGERGKILLYDVTGRRVAEIPVIGDGPSVNVSWDGGNENSHKIASGVYFYRAEVDGLKAAGKIVFFKQ